MAYKANKIKSWTNRMKVAALLLLLDEDSAAGIIKNIDDSNLVVSLAKEISMVGVLSEEDQYNLLDEIYDILNLQVGKMSGSLQKAESILVQAYGKEVASNILDKMTNTIHRVPFEFLRMVDPEQIVAVIQGEHSQVISLVLSYLPVDKASKVLQLLPEDIRSDCSLRLAKMDKTNPEILSVVEKTLERRFAAVMNQASSTQNVGGVDAIAEILNRLDRSIEKKILEDLEIIDQDLAVDIRNLMFVFEDIIKLDDKAMQTVMKEVDMKELPLALKGADDDIRELFFNNMSEKAANLLKDELEMMGPVLAKDVSAAQSQIVETIKALEESGQIMIRSEGEEEALIE
ncbi:MAG: flagellar motor switch protein FliG [Candidatus Caenarcaniphilales bacterium]|nr:flagellar motor switch protein FliG [Candidatus Caenarcaniphilales bacterium]